MGLFGTSKPAAPKLEPVVFKQADNFKGFTGLRLDHFACEGNNILMHDRLIASKGKNALPDNQPYRATINFLPVYDENMKPCYEVVIDNLLAGKITDSVQVSELSKGNYTEAYVKAEITNSKKTVRLFAKHK